MSTTIKDIKLPSLLAFERKLEVSDGLMHSGNWSDIEKADGWNTISITKRQNRSTQSAYGIDDDKKSQPNPVASDSDDANLPMDKDTLRLSFSLRVIGNLGKPFACNDPDFQQAIVEKINEFKKKDGSGLETLALRYAYNIANGRFLWRNRVCAEQITTKVFLSGNETPLTFNATDYSLNEFSQNSNADDLQVLKSHILNGLNGGENSFVFLKMEAYAKLGAGQHVFPSQEMNMNSKGKELFQLEGCAAVHNVKIGNAIRTIDNWYTDAQFPIAAEPYGSVTQIGQAFRKTKKECDLYTLLLSWLDGNDLGEQVHYVVANLIRGGLFQGEGKEAKKGKNKKSSEDGE
ncbi:MAG: type I-F CRISPR-associated protein Csy3 [Pseudohongiellaceae bacterium]